MWEMCKRVYCKSLIHEGCYPPHTRIRAAVEREFGQDNTIIQGYNVYYVCHRTEYIRWSWPAHFESGSVQGFYLLNAPMEEYWASINKAMVLTCSIWKVSGYNFWRELTLYTVYTIDLTIAYEKKQQHIIKSPIFFLMLCAMFLEQRSVYDTELDAFMKQHKRLLPNYCTVVSHFEVNQQFQLISLHVLCSPISPAETNMAFSIKRKGEWEMHDVLSIATRHMLHMYTVKVPYLHLLSI